MKQADLISGVFWLGLGAMCSYWSVSYEVGSLTRPGPGLLPLILGILLIVLSLVLLGKSWKENVGKRRVLSIDFSVGWERVWSTVLILMLATFSFERIGYLLTVFLLIVFLMLDKDLKSVKQAILTALLTTAGVHIVFVRLLGQPFPRGLLRF